MDNRSVSRHHRTAIPVLLLLSVFGIAFAQDGDNAAGDPPGRVARLSFTKGAVSLQPAGVQDWADATLNRPLTTGDRLWADQDGRAELDIGTAAIRLGASTGVSFLNLDDRTSQLNVTAGTVIVHVRDLPQDQNFEIDTPNIALTLQSPGDFRVEVSDAGDSTLVKVSNGDALATGPGQSVPLHTQQAMAFAGTNQLTVDAAEMGGPDALDDWSLERDRRTEQAQSNQYVAPEVAGSQDLDDYGTWTPEPDYGYVWTPTAVAVGWTPYHFGRWVWVAPWGWTWIDDAPWGFAPFHYGRWAYIDARWCWVPGPRVGRPVYAPALVAWVGGPGAAVSVSVGGGGVGWFPLGPREVYVPGYHVSNTYVRNVNITNTTIVNNTYITNVYENKVTNITYANRSAPGAVTAVPQTVFTSAQPVAGHTVRIPERDLARLTPTATAPAIAPAHQSVLGTASVANARRPPQAVLSRPVVARMAPPPAPVPFERQQDAIRANGGRPLARAQLAELQPRGAPPQQRVRIVTPPPGQRGRDQAHDQQARSQPARDQQPRGQQAPDQRTLQEREHVLQTPAIPAAARTPASPRVDQPASPRVDQSARQAQPSGYREDRPGSSVPNERAPAPVRSDRPPPANRPELANRPLPADRAPQNEPRPAEQPSRSSTYSTRPEAHAIDQPRATPIEPRATPAEPRAYPVEPRPAPSQQRYSAPLERQPPPEQPRAMPVPPRPEPQRAESPRPAPPPPRAEEHHDKPQPQRSDKDHKG